MSLTTTAPSSKVPRRGVPPVRAIREPDAEPIVTPEALIERLGTYLESDAITEVERAYAYARDAHEGQMRRTGDPHICALGIPTEGKIWFNAADARPDVNSSAIGQLSDWAEAAVARLGER